MRSKTTSWFETKVRYDKTMEDGQNKKVTEAYTVEALSFSEAESAITEEMSHYISGEFDVKAITPAAYGEIFFSDADSDDKWFKARLAFITIDEKNRKGEAFHHYLPCSGSLCQWCSEACGRGYGQNND